MSEVSQEGHCWHVNSWDFDLSEAGAIKQVKDSELTLMGDKTKESMSIWGLIYVCNRCDNA